MITALFDFSFNRLITRKLIGIVYGVALVVILLSGMAVAVPLIALGGWGVFFGLVAVPAAMLLWVLIARVVAEAAVVYFRIAEDVQQIKSRELVS